MPPVPLHVIAFKSLLPCISKYFCYHCLLIRSPSLAVTANTCHSRLYPSSSACRAQLHASWAAAQNHALGDRSCYLLEVYFHPFCICLCLFFVLVLFALWQPFPSYLSSWILNLIAVFSTLCPLSCSTTHIFVGFNLFTRPFAYDAIWSVASWTSTLQAFLSPFPPFFCSLLCVAYNCHYQFQEMYKYLSPCLAEQQATVAHFPSLSLMCPSNDCSFDFDTLCCSSLTSQPASHIFPFSPVPC